MNKLKLYNLIHYRFSTTSESFYAKIKLVTDKKTEQKFCAIPEIITCTKELNDVHKYNLVIANAQKWMCGYWGHTKRL